MGWVIGHNVSHEPTIRNLDPQKDNGGFIVATFYGPNAHANARLAAAAHKLLGAARMVLTMRESIEHETYGVKDEMAALADAVAEAEGA